MCKLVSNLIKRALLTVLAVCASMIMFGEGKAQTAPVLSSPSDYSIYNGNNTSSITFSWSSVSGALEYWLNVFPEGNSANSKFDGSVGTATSRSLSGITTWSSGVYIWQARVRTSGGWSGYSTARQFIVDRPPDPPTLSAPSDGSIFAIGTSTNFNWSGPAGVSVARYTFRIVSGTDLNQNQIIHQDPGYTGSRTFDDATYDPGTHTWGVRAIKVTPVGYNQTTYESTIGWGGYATRTFQLIGPPPAPPTLTSPSNNAIAYDATPDLVWAQASGSVNYFHVQVARDSSFLDLVSDEQIWQSFNYTPPLLSDGRYYWHVMSHGTNGAWSDWSSTRIFIVDAIISPPALTSPSNGTSVVPGSDITFQWSESTGATRYILKVCTNATMTNCISGNPFEPPLGQQFYPVSAAHFASGTTYYWQVAAITSDEAVGWGPYGPSTPWSFIVTTFTVNPQVSVSPASGPQGTVFSQPGGGFTPNGMATLFFSGPDGPSTDSETVLADGTYQHSWTCDACPVGTYTYYARDEATQMNSDPVTFTVTEPGMASFTPLYRLYKGGTVKDHFYTIDASERDDAVNNHGFLYERIEGFVSSAAFTDSAPLYRLYHAGGDVHFYTSSTSEKDVKVAAGYRLENTYYIYPYTNAQPQWTSPLYYAAHAGNTDNFYTTSWYEYWNATRTGGWGFAPNGIIGYVSTRIANNRPQGSVAGIGMAVGNFVPPAFTDLSLKGVGPQLSFSRYYDSFSPGTSLGQGWSFNYDSYILEDTTGGIHIEWGNGSESHFYSILGTLVPRPGYFERAVKVDDIMNYGYKIMTKDQTVYEFRRLSIEGAGPNILLISITDRFNNTLNLDRQASYGLVMSATDSTGRIFNYEYTPVSISDGRTVQRLTKVTDTSLAPNRLIKVAYNSQGNLWKVTDARNNTTTYGYNADGLLTSMTYPEGNTVSVTYNGLMQITGYTNGSIWLAFDGYGTENGTSVKDVANGNSVLARYQHDEFRATTINFPADGTTISSQFGSGNYVNLRNWIKDRLNQTTNYTYDDNGNVTSVKNALNETTRFEYDEKNNLTAVVDPRNDIFRTVLTYDTATKNKLESVRKPLGGTTNYTYWNNGLVWTITDPTSHSITYTYDANGNVTKIQDNALSTSIDFTNDNAGRRKTQTDQARPTPQLTTWEYDNNDNVISMQVASNPAAIFNYDKNNRLTSVVDQRSKATVYTYNTMNLLASQQSPDLKTWQYAYDSVGNLSSVALPDGNSVAYAYDANKRLQYVRYNGTEKLFYTYDTNGNVLSLRVDGDNGKTTSFIYNAANRVASVTDQFGNVIGYGYDTAGNRISITYPGSKVVNYTYDADNRLSTVRDWLGSSTTTYTYNSAGILRSVANANGTTTTYGYDPANRLISLANKKDATIITDYSLNLDNVGNPTSITRNELLVPPVPLAVDISYGYNNANQIQSAGTVTYTHDGLGNVSGASNSRSFSFDFDNRLTNATIGGDVFSYNYDGFGNRISRTKGSTQTKYLLDLNADMTNVLAETNAGGTVQNYYIHGQGLLSRINNSGQRFTYHYDTVGNTVAVTDDSGVVIESYAYDEFGGTLTTSPPNITNPFRYVGKYGVMDEENGLLFMRARYYDADTGRFISRDPIGFEGGDLNLYAYVGGNPVIGTDPTGLEKRCEVSLGAGPYVSFAITKDSKGNEYVTFGYGVGIGAEGWCSFSNDNSTRSGASVSMSAGTKGPLGVGEEVTYDREGVTYKPSIGLLCSTESKYKLGDRAVSYSPNVKCGIGESFNIKSNLTFRALSFRDFINDFLKIHGAQ